MRAVSLSVLFVSTSLLLTPIELLAESSDISKSDLVDDNKLIVTAELKDENIMRVPSSITIIDDEVIQLRNAQHFSDLLNLAPNINFATGASRGRFIQIRGIGERSEFSEPVNYSVGVVVDGIDFTGVATGATLLDIQQVEVLRGPQGTLYGANGLAGLINLVSNSPTDSFFANVTTSVEEYGGFGLSGIVSNSLSKQLGYRFAVKKYQSDGYMDNLYLDRDDTNNLDEMSLRGKIVFQPSEQLTLTSNIFLTDVDNGYDAFSLDSNRNTYSDNPGHDKQDTQAASFILDWQINSMKRLETIVSFADSDLEYGYDEDWSHPGICDNTACDSEIWGYDWWYASFDNFSRENENQSIDVRLHSDTTSTISEDMRGASWVIGFYYRNQTMDLLREYTYLDNHFSSQFDTANSAIYGQIKTPLSNQLNIIAGLRFEKRDADYIDSNDVMFNPDENLWGGKIAIEYQYDTDKMIYALVSRGYKNGGFNTEGSLNEKDREYDTEFMWNYEAGIKGYWFEKSLRLQTSVFYQDRDDVQIKQSIVRSLADDRAIQEGGECPCSFTDYTQNATASKSYGVEFEALWRAYDDLSVYSSLGILKTQFEDFQSFTHILADLETIPPVPYNMNGREQAHSPSYQLVLGSHYFISENWRVNPEIEAKDSFYFSDRHEEKSKSYAVFNLRLSYIQTNWQVNLFVNNLTDKDIQTRGFGSFGNDPRKFYETEPYYQFAAPRVVGISASVNFE
ncbi:TonB-dependent receptor [Aliikangiella sp. IMCC44359]|uniref:TonB-dependent receptor n=1 Tax=Aliikangiella sp. IMCC44359 TaxID=3459125 RepID=UPI00403AE8F7